MQIKTATFRELIEDRVPFTTSNTGWFSGKCHLCDDYKVRAGFKFEGDSIIYNCWNCATKAVQKENATECSGKFRKILNAYGISNDDIRAVTAGAFFNNAGARDTLSLGDLSSSEISTATPETSLPIGSIALGSTKDYAAEQNAIRAYLDSRHIDYNKYPFYFAPSQNKLIDRVIVPFYRAGKLIYWQGRKIVPCSSSDRYYNSPAVRTSVMWNMDALASWSTAPLFVTEGVFDAMIFDGIALLGGGRVSDAKISLIKKSPRRIIFVLDKNSVGAATGESALKNGWEIALAPDGCNDINHSVSRFGKIWTASELMKSVCSGEKARMAMKVYCT